MNWIEGISEVINYIEANLENDLKIEEIAQKAFASSFCFQKSFSMLCGFTVGEYIRNRRLASAGNDLLTTDEKVTDIALKYGYGSIDSFTKAFTRFHGATPTAVRKNGCPIKSYAPLKLEIFVKGGYIMDYRILKEEAQCVKIKVDKEQKIIYCIDDGKLQSLTFFRLGMYLPNNKEYQLSGDYTTKFCRADMCGNTEGFSIITLPAVMCASFQCKGTSRIDAREKTWDRIKNEWLPQTNYELLTPNYIMVNYPTNDKNSNFGEIIIAIKEKNHN